jgi:molybdopterin-guanine dinucleotide biosynthesis protein A
MANEAGREPISAVVVAGGKSVRLGQDKRKLRLWGADGPTLLEHTIEIMATYTDDVVVVLNDAEGWSSLPGRVVGDVFPDMGSLGGIYSGLFVAKYAHSFVVAADMPLLNGDLIAWMIAQPRDFDVLLPRVGSGRARNRLGVESLHGIYGTGCRGPMRQQLEAGNPQVIGFFPDVRVRLVEPEIVARFDPEGIAFKNVNTPDELAEVQRLINDE